MTKSLKNNLVNEYRQAFHKTYELGGGYGFRFYHGLRVMNYCEKFLRLNYFKNKTINKDILLVAALFHDIGKIKAVDKCGEIKYDSEANQKHDLVGAQVIFQYIGKYFKNDAIINQIKQIITEQHSDRQTTIEAQIIKDADRLDNYGCIQIWRHMTYAHQTQKNIDRIPEYWLKEKARESALEYLKKFHFTAIRRIAARRFKKLDYLISEIRKEIEGLDIK